MGEKHRDIFEDILSIPVEGVELIFEYDVPEWPEYVFNPRRLRGSDFLMRWSQGRWSEKRIMQAINRTKQYVAIPYGPSSIAPPQENVQEFERYFQRLEETGLGKIKRPDLLVLRAKDRRRAEKIIARIGGVRELPFQQENSQDMAKLIRLAVVALECENSLWIAQRMPQYGISLKPQKRLGGKPGLRKGAVVPTVILKDEDRKPLKRWQKAHSIPIHIWHVFYDLAYGISLNKAEKLIRKGMIERDEQKFQAPSGPNDTKSIYKIYYQHCYCVGQVVKKPCLIAKRIIDKNGHVLPYVRFQGGQLKLTSEALEVLNNPASGDK
jgi:hypothetical protein